MNSIECSSVVQLIKQVQDIGDHLHLYSSLTLDLDQGHSQHNGATLPARLFKKCLEFINKLHALEKVVLNLGDSIKTDQLLSAFSSLTKLKQVSLHLPNSHGPSSVDTIKQIMTNNTLNHLSLSLVNSVLPEQMLGQILGGNQMKNLNSLRLNLTNSKVCSDHLEFLHLAMSQSTPPLHQLELVLDRNFMTDQWEHLCSLLSLFPQLDTLCLSILDNQYPINNFDQVLLQLGSLYGMRSLQLSVDNISMSPHSLDLLIRMITSMPKLEELSLKVLSKEGLSIKQNTNIRDLLTILKDTSVNKLSLCLQESEVPHHILTTQIIQGLSSLTHLQKLSLDFLGNSLLLSHVDFFSFINKSQCFPFMKELFIDLSSQQPHRDVDKQEYNMGMHLQSLKQLFSLLPSLNSLHLDLRNAFLSLPQFIRLLQSLMSQQNLVKVVVVFKAESFASLSTETQRQMDEVYDRFQQLVWHKVKCIYQIVSTEKGLLGKMQHRSLIKEIVEENYPLKQIQ